MNSPAWWFSTVLVAIIASLFAGFLRDWIPSWLSRYSTRAKLRNYRRKKILAKTIRAYLFSPQYYLSASLSMLYDITYMLFLLILSLTLPPLHSFFTNNPQYDPLQNYAPHLPPSITGIISLGFISALIPYLFSLNRKLTLLTFAHNRIRKKAMFKVMAPRTIGRNRP